MICKKCNATIDDKSLFCGYCGAKVERENLITDNNIIQNNNLNQNIGLNAESVNDVMNTMSNSLENQNSIVNENMNSINQNQPEIPIVQNIFENNSAEPLNSVPVQQVQQSMPVNSQVESKPKNKKKGLLIGIVVGVVAMLIVLLTYLLVFNNKSKNTVSVLNKALNNYISNGQNSGTIRLSVVLGTENMDAFNVSADFKYEKSNDEYNLDFTLNKSTLFDEIKIYAKSSKDDITLYTKSSIVDLLGFTKSDTDTWLYYMINLDEFSIEEDIDFSNSFDVSDLLDSKSFVYIDENNGVRHYQLKINNQLMEKISSELSDDEKEEIDNFISNDEYSEVLKKGINLDFYINKSNELEKISIDLTEFLSEESLTVSTAILNIEFINLNNTKVNIPSDVLYTTMDLTTYFSNYSSSEQNIDLDISYDLSTDMSNIQDMSDFNSFMNIG